jgi:hypothetical protein
LRTAQQTAARRGRRPRRQRKPTQLALTPDPKKEGPDLPEVEFVRTEWTQSTEADEFGRPKSGPRNTGCTTRNAGPHSEPASDESGCGGPIRTAFS